MKNVSKKFDFYKPRQRSVYQNVQNKILRNFHNFHFFEKLQGIKEKIDRIFVRYVIQHKNEFFKLDILFKSYRISVRGWSQKISFTENFLKHE